MTINFYSKEVYGQTLYYLAGSGDARLWQLLTGKKTITEADMNNLSVLTEYTFNRVFEAEA